jgi:phosphatidylethanolamine/phosphatidyl-N-methylethanolamine N-methyltransferase
VDFDSLVSDYYKDYYSCVHGGSTTGRAASLMQKHLETKRSKSEEFTRVLELGAGTMQHFPFVEHKFKTNVPFDDSSFDRVIATCLLLHLPEPIDALRDWIRILKPGGVADLLIPCEPGLALRSYRKLISRPRANRLGFKYFDLVNAVDHKNYAASMIQIVNHLDDSIDVQFSWRPFNRIQSWNLNLQMVAHLTKK